MIQTTMISSQLKLPFLACLFYSYITHPTTAVFSGSTLIWSDLPFGYGRARILGIEGKPEEWIGAQKMKLRQINSPSANWHFRGLAFSYANNYLYWSESGYRKIQGLILNGKKETDSIYHGTSTQVDGLAVDWISGNLYWTDAIYNWIMMVPLKPNQTRYKIVTDLGLDKPHGIAVLPQKGYLFWSDWGEVPKIEVSDLIGNNRRVVVDEDMKKPRGLLVDAKDNKIYWVDNGKHTVECIQFNGMGRRVIVQDDVSSFYGIALYQNYLFVTEQSEGHLKVYNKVSGKSLVNYHLGNMPYGIIMFDKSTQPGNSDMCEALQCEHFCIHDPIKGPACHCSEGYKLNDDHKNCTEYSQFRQPYHVYSIHEGICHFPANLADMNINNVTLNNQCFLLDSKGYLALGMHAKSDTLYFSTNNTDKWINRVRMEYDAPLENIVGGVGIVQGIALDWVSSNLYWTDSLHKTINVAREDGMYQQVLIDEALENPLGIAVHPGRSILIWTDSGNHPKVEWAYLDGSGRTLITNNSLGHPSHVFVDFKKDMLYWADTLLGVVSSYDFDQKTIKIVFPKPSHAKESIFGISIFQDYLLWTDFSTERNGIHVARLDTMTKVRDILHPDVGMAYDLLTFDSQNQPDFETPCPAETCQHLCLPGEDRSFWCKCGLGYHLGEDGHTCVTDLSVDNFLLVTDGYRKQIFQISIPTRKVHALDIEDHFRPFAVDYDPLREMIYWTDVAHKSIKKAKFHEKQETLVKKLTEDSIADGLAVDSVNQLLFYSDAGQKIIGVMTLTDHSFHKTLISTDLEKVRSVIASTLERRIYWSDWGSRPRIERCGMDGSDRKVIFNFESGAWPNGLAIDVKAKRIYWVDARSNKIASMTTEGKNYRLLYNEADAHYFGIALSGDYLYLTDWSRNSLVRLPKNGGKLENFWDGTSKFVRLNGIHAYNSSEIVYDISPCSSVSCSHFCLPSPLYERICACPDHLMLSDDLQNCITKTADVTSVTFSSSVKITNQNFETTNETTPTSALFRTHTISTARSLASVGSISSSATVAAICIVSFLLLGGAIIGAFILKKRHIESNPHQILNNEQKENVDAIYRISCAETSNEAVDIRMETPLFGNYGTNIAETDDINDS